MPWCGSLDKFLHRRLCFLFSSQPLPVLTPDLCVESVGVYSPKQVGLGGGALLCWSCCLLTLQLSGGWKLLRLLQWLVRKDSIDSVQNPISLRTSKA